MMRLKTVQFLAVILTAVAFVPAGAHIFALPNKIGLTQEEYFIVQGIYRGWALFGIVIAGALAANLAFAFLTQDQRLPPRLAAFTSACLIASLVIFFIWTYPANATTDNWTQVPDNWEALRTQWEYSHAANAIVLFAALCSVTLAALLARD